MSKVVKGVARAVKKVVKGVANVVKKIAKSKIGKILIAAAAIYFGGAALMGGFKAASAGTSVLSGMGSGLSSAASGLSSAWGALTTGNVAGAGSALKSGFMNTGVAAPITEAGSVVGSSLTTAPLPPPGIVPPPTPLPPLSSVTPQPPGLLTRAMAVVEKHPTAAAMAMQGAGSVLSSMSAQQQAEDEREHQAALEASKAQKIGTHIFAYNNNGLHDLHRR